MAQGDCVYLAQAQLRSSIDGAHRVAAAGRACSRVPSAFGHLAVCPGWCDWKWSLTILGVLCVVGCEWLEGSDGGGRWGMSVVVAWGRGLFLFAPAFTTHLQGWTLSCFCLITMRISGTASGTGLSPLHLYCTFVHLCALRAADNITLGLLRDRLVQPRTSCQWRIVHPSPEPSSDLTEPEQVAGLPYARHARLLGCRPCPVGFELHACACGGEKDDVDP